MAERSVTGSATPLICPGCGSAFGEQERFCPDCKLPLTLERPPGGEVPVSDRHAWARKIKPQLAEGSLVRVAGARNQAEAEFIQGMLLEEGVPSLLRRSAGFDVPDFLAAGPRDIMVPASGVDTARQVLLEAELISPDFSRPAVVTPGRLLVGLLIALAIGAAIVWAMAELVG
jgi:hypothetical protein